MRRLALAYSPVDVMWTFFVETRISRHRGSAVLLPLAVATILQVGCGSSSASDGAVDAGPSDSVAAGDSGIPLFEAPPCPDGQRACGATCCPWTTTTVPTAVLAGLDPSSALAVAIDSGGTLHVAVVTGTNGAILQHAQFDGAQWTVDVAATAGPGLNIGFSFPALGFDLSREPLVAAVLEDPTLPMADQRRVVVARRSAGVWTTDVAAAGPVDRHLAVGTDSMGVDHVSFYRGVGLGRAWLARSPGTWSPVPAGTTRSGDLGGIDAAGNLWSFRCPMSSDSGLVFGIDRYVGSTWAWDPEPWPWQKISCPIFSDVAADAVGGVHVLHSYGVSQSIVYQSTPPNRRFERFTRNGWVDAEDVRLGASPEGIPAIVESLHSRNAFVYRVRSDVGWRAGSLPRYRSTSQFYWAFAMGPGGAPAICEFGSDTTGRSLRCSQ